MRLLDLSTAADDPRASAVETALRAEAVPREWRWLETESGLAVDFSMTGDTVRPITIEEDPGADEDGFFERVLDALPEQGIVAQFDLEGNLTSRQGHAAVT